MRGSDIVQQTPTKNLRFTPAGAGIGWAIRQINEERPVHPRRCGDRVLLVWGNFNDYGSPPQVRGSDAEKTLNICQARFTPAGAGIGHPVAVNAQNMAVHPRRCGDRLSGRRLAIQPYGSPPQVRGSDSAIRVRASQWRFTPAGAGIGISPEVSMRLLPVHPRRCGDRLGNNCNGSCHCGSPPQVRGSAQAKQAKEK